MTFDELWRMNLVEKKKRMDSATDSGTQPIDAGSRSEREPELELTNEDRSFLLQVGVTP